ncbi:hypothetical protein [uncultured Polaribacter sp.]|uniref:hypothetical protein n=1 Tax=uncultured Polaribacter sp. TaxID=174711 RepID=UPI00262A644D|nr:hypothetical protein [uncultured Polaribacter sp.]
MKTKFIKTYKPREGYGFEWIFNTDKSTTITISNKFQSPTFIDKYVNGKIIDSICLDKYKDFKYASSFNGYGVINSSDFFGLIFKTDKIILWRNHDFEKYSIVKVKDSLTLDINNYHKVSLSCYNEYSNKFIVALEDLYYKNGAPRYVSSLKINQKSFLRKPSANFEKTLFELPKDKYPKVSINDDWPNHDWLNIRDIFTNEHFLYIYSTGGAKTRTKSGSAWDYSIVSKFDFKKNWICNFEIAKGQGNHSSDKKYFILRPQEKKKRLYFYSTKDFTKKFELSLTSKQNLGIQKNSGILKFDLFGENFIIYSNDYLNFCKLKN